jgi:hypothetical protein
MEDTVTVAELIFRLQSLEVDRETTFVQGEMFDIRGVEDRLPLVIESINVESHPDGGGGPNTVFITMTEDM